VLLGSRGWATIYIGSYGDRDRSFGWRIGRLKIWINYNPLFWFRGMCQPGALSWALLSVGSIPGFLRLWLGFMVLFSVMGLLGSVVPSARRRFTFDGKPVYPDLILIVRLWRSKRLA